jgi:hypothetical protein
MPDLDFAVTGAEPVADAAAPTLAFRLHITNKSSEPIHNISLRCQLRIESPKRRYSEGEAAGLVDLFGETSRWGQTLRSLLWANTGMVVGPFERETDVALQVACTYDFNVAVAKYFDALDSGEVPLLFLFSGTVFHANGEGTLQIAQIPWTRECAFRLPVRIWKEMMALYYPNTAWLCLRKDVFDRLHDYKMRHGIPTWEQALESILP